jgi:hypothetical protein
MTCHEAPQESRPAAQDMPGLQTPFCLAQEMGKGLGRGALLFETLSVDQIEVMGRTERRAGHILPGFLQCPLRCICDHRTVFMGLRSV